MDFRLSVVKSAWQDFQQKQTLWELTTPEGKDRQLRQTGGIAIVGEAEGILAGREIRVHIVESVPNIEREEEPSTLRERVANILAKPGRKEQKLERLLETFLNDEGDDELALGVYDALRIKGVLLPCQAVR